MKSLRWVRQLLLLTSVCLAASCGGRASTLAPTGVGTSPASGVNLSGGGNEGAGAISVLAGAGDIADCGQGAYATATLLDRIPGTVFTAGDNAYFSGTAAQFARCYDPTWGRHRARTRPSPGNHEYEKSESAYFDYFGENAGPRGLGYYSYTLGSWKIFSLNSEAPSGPGSAQNDWLRRELSATRSNCTLAYWHRPLFSSGRLGDNPDMRDLWRTLYESGVDIVVNGHDHLYERFGPQDPDGRPDAIRGIRQFTVGTGGAQLTGITSVRPNSETRATVWGVIVFTLFDRGYDWKFVPVADETSEDSGTGSCH